MKTLELVIAGFGGQGILFVGEVLARAAVADGRHVTWMPSYGPEQRGGTATCTVVISDEPIGSPVVADPGVAIIMNRPSLDKFEPRVRPAGLLIVNSSMVDRSVERTDVRVIVVDAARQAAALEAAGVANMVMLGALLAIEPPVSWDALRTALHEMLSSHPQLVEINLMALARGREVARRQIGGLIAGGVPVAA